MSFVDALDKHTMKSVGENGNVEYTWSNDFKEKFTQFYFQLVRTKDTKDLEKQLTDLLTSFSEKETKKGFEKFGQTYKYHDEFIMLYKLIGHTRDVKEGKGEYSLSYMQLWVWYQHHPEHAVNALKTFVELNNDHPYGSWKDIKYFAEYVKNRDSESHPLVNECVNIICRQLKMDLINAELKHPVSLAGKWCPREKGRFSWMFKLIAHKMFSDVMMTTNKTENRVGYIRACRKVSSLLRKELSHLNKYLDTTQVKMCGKNWSAIEFNNVTSRTMEKNKSAFLNSKGITDVDRIDCAENLKAHIKQAMKGDDMAKVRGKRVDVYELVRSAIMNKTSDERNITNLQWKDNATQNGGLKNIIPMADTSGSMQTDNNTPLYNSIGLSIRISELAEAPFNNRIMTFNSTPEWVRLTDSMSFTDKVKVLKNSPWGMNTNFYSAMRMILDAVLESNMKPSDVSGMTLAIFSDMQIDQASRENTKTMMENIKEMYYNAGMESAWRTPYEAPHILFWNLRKTSGFPTLSSENNVTMLSGYSAQLLNIFCNKGIEELKTMTPYRMITDILSSRRYKPLETFATIFNI